MTEPKILGDRLLVPENDFARSLASGLGEDGVWAGLSLVVVVLLRCREGRETEEAEVGVATFGLWCTVFLVGGQLKTTQVSRKETDSYIADGWRSFASLVTDFNADRFSLFSGRLSRRRRRS